jgi:hypothetical protein
MRVRLGARERNRVVGQAAQDGAGQQLRSGKIAGTRLHNVVVGACMRPGRGVTRLQLLTACWPGWCLQNLDGKTAITKPHRAVHAVVECKSLRDSPGDSSLSHAL